MTTINELAVAVDAIHTRLVGAENALQDAINQVIFEREEVLKHISASMAHTVEHLERHQTMIRNLLDTPGETSPNPNHDRERGNG